MLCCLNTLTNCVYDRALNSNGVSTDNNPTIIIPYSINPNDFAIISTFDNFGSNGNFDINIPKSLILVESLSSLQLLSSLLFEVSNSCLSLSKRSSCSSFLLCKAPITVRCSIALVMNS